MYPLDRASPQGVRKGETIKVLQDISPESRRYSTARREVEAENRWIDEWINHHKWIGVVPLLLLLLL